MQERQKQTIQIIILTFLCTNYVFWIYASTFYGNFTQWLSEVYSGTGMTCTTLLLLSNVMGICLLLAYFWTESRKITNSDEFAVG